MLSNTNTTNTSRVLNKLKEHNQNTWLAKFLWWQSQLPMQQQKILWLNFFLRTLRLKKNRIKRLTRLLIKSRRKKKQLAAKMMKEQQRQISQQSVLILNQYKQTALPTMLQATPLSNVEKNDMCCKSRWNLCNMQKIYLK